ncbi:hypothetical protein ACVWXM_003340 [Bradyrhizobium sp. GM7.3]
MKAVEDDTDRGVIGAPHDLPGIAVIVDVASPGQCLVADAQRPFGRALAKLAKIIRGAVDAAERGRRHVGADQQQIGAELLHQVELAFGAGKVSRTLRLRHAFEIAERLKRTDLEIEVPAELCDVARTCAERQQIVLENLDRVESGGCDGAELFVESAGE